MATNRLSSKYLPNKHKIERVIVVLCNGYRINPYLEQIIPSQCSTLSADRPLWVDYKNTDFREKAGRKARRSGAVKGIRMSSRSTPSMGAVRLTAGRKPLRFRHYKKISLGLLAVAVGILVTTQSSGTIDENKLELQVLSTPQVQPTFFFDDQDDALANQQPQPIVRRPVGQIAGIAAPQRTDIKTAQSAVQVAMLESNDHQTTKPVVREIVIESSAQQPMELAIATGELKQKTVISSDSNTNSAAVGNVLHESMAPGTLLAMNTPADSAATALQPQYTTQPQDALAAVPELSVDNPFVDNDTTPKTTTVSPLVNHPALAAIRKKAEFPDGATTESVTVAAGDTLSKLLNDRGVKIEHMPQLLTDDVIKQHLSNLDIGQTFQVVRLASGEFHSLVAKVGSDREITIRRSDKGYATASIDLPLEKERVVTSGTIEQSLYVAADLANLKQSTIMELSDIFQWELDFARDIRKGDQFSLIYDRLYRDGKYIGDGDILAAEFVRGGKHYQAIRYTDPDGNTGYYSPDGRSKRRTFLRHPVDVVRITSKFDPKRVHPVLHQIRAHKGVDYGSPTGTPIRATADGIVRFAGRKSAYGKTVILSHGTDIRTLYAHMSRISDKVGSGKRVKQGDVIGYVGATGRVTGAHLHYEFQKNGNHVDPLKVELPAAQPLKAELRDDLRDLSDDLLAQMQSVVPQAASGLNAKRRATPTRCSCIGITNNKLRTFEPLGVVDLSPSEILKTHWVDQQLDAFFFNLGIAVIHYFSKCESILEP